MALGCKQRLKKRRTLLFDRSALGHSTRCAAPCGLHFEFVSPSMLRAQRTTALGACGRGCFATWRAVGARDGVPAAVLCCCRALVA
eukprot:5752768-Prymnesium_polylepis.1